MKNILGKYYRILDYKLVMGFPQSHIPDWIKKEGSHSINLAKFIKPKYRDITFMGSIFIKTLLIFQIGLLILYSIYLFR